MFPLLKKSSFFAQTFIFPILSISNPQWGTSHENTKTWRATLPISSSKSYAALASDSGAAALPIGANADSNTICFYQNTANDTILFYLVISKV